MKQTLFIHIPRTAGTSINAVAEELIPSYQDLGYKLLPSCNLDSCWTTTQHISIQSLIDRNVFSQDWFDAQLKFTFVRNPWDRLLSLYYHLKGYRLNQKRQRESNDFLSDFPTFVRALLEKTFVQPLSRLNVNDWSQANTQMKWLQWGVDFVVRYESLEEDWKMLCSVIGMTYKPLPRMKQTNHAGSYQTYYDGETKELVAIQCAEEIERFGYKF